MIYLKKRIALKSLKYQRQKSTNLWKTQGHKLVNGLIKKEECICVSWVQLVKDCSSIEKHTGSYSSVQVLCLPLAHKLLSVTAEAVIFFLLCF